MAEVFVSYARPDEPHAVRVVDALRASGFAVWRDDQLPAHGTYADVIEERLKGAKAVVVLWSADAVKSQWVRAEADAARNAGTLVQASVDGTLPPMPFNQIQCAELRDWTSEDEPGWRKLAESVAILAGAVEAASEAAPRANRKAREQSVCVLPFANMSGDAEQEYFSDGISEDITTDLSQVSALAVTARNTAFTFKGQAVDVCEVARKLGVSHVLEGSVRKVGTRVRITAQLIDGKTGDHVWAERFDRDLTDIFAIQDEISKAIVAALKLKLLPEEKKAIEQRGTISADAYQLYLMARNYWVNGNYGDIRREQRVMRICGRAVEIDPYYAQAWALLAIAQSSLRYGFGSEVDDGVAAAHSALAIDPSIAEAHCPMARRLEEKGRYDEAVGHIETALRLDPESWDVNKEAARAHICAGRVAEATRHFEQAVAVMESDVHAWGMLVTCYQALGDPAGLERAARMSIAEAEKVLAHDPSNGAAIGVGAAGFAALGQPDRARDWIDRAMLIDPDNLTMRYNFACMMAAHLGDREGALRQLERVLAVASGTVVRAAQADPGLASVRDDPRFAKALAAAAERLKIDRTGHCRLTTSASGLA